jgi:hypothetical protein
MNFSLHAGDFYLHAGERLAKSFFRCRGTNYSALDKSQAKVTPMGTAVVAD